ncbi:glycosyltransferase family 4 protein [Liquorilactobacillus hordei]|uniref:glycosyltransferase family 4 protein n=1 Tax=Liquorilactobacillus hordei TaxID=468911 RepID=UPI0039EABAF0
MKNVYSFNGISGHWKDVDLTKDCGAIPFLLHKVYGYKAIMVSTKEKFENYPSLMTRVQGMVIEFLPTKKNFLEEQMDYVKQNFERIDVLVLYGAYTNYFNLLNVYKKLRPDGKVYIGLDANSFWMDRIDWKSPKFSLFLSQCDVIGASSRIMQSYLSAKWPFKINYIPNGFYNFENIDMNFDFAEKENTILTVGRIGTNQKNNELLLEAFAMVASKLPNWKVRLVGPIEEQFKNYINEYFKRNAELKNKIIFVGELKSKAALIKEYQKAKIFVLTSRLEGSPNVIAEAMFCGCYNIFTNFDIATETTENGRYGKIVNNKEELARQFLISCRNQKVLLKGGKSALEYAQKNYDFNQIIKRLHYLMFKEG